MQLISDKKDITPFITDQPMSEPHNKGLLILILDFKYKDKNVNIKITAGSIWDGASIPRICWTFTGSPFLPEFIKASLVHDYIYKTGKYSKKIADKTFLKLLLENEVKKYTAYKMYYAVKFGGIFGWNKWRKKNGNN